MRRFAKILLISTNVLLVSLCSSPTAARDKKSSQGQESKAKETATFNLKVPVNVVVVSIVANDHQGNPVRDLTAEEFKVYEDGKPQSIHTFAKESYKVVQTPDAEKRTAAVTPEPETIGDRPHYIALMIDDLNAPAYDSLYRTIEAIKKYIAENINHGDQIGITSASGRIQIPFTSDAEVLRDQLVNLVTRLDRRQLSQLGCAQLTESQALAIERFLGPGTIPSPHGDSPEEVEAYLRSGGCRFGSFPSEVQVAIVETVVCQNLEAGFLAVQRAADLLPSIAAAISSESTFRHRAMLSAVRQYVRSMRHFEGRKSLILFSEGFVSEPVRYELQDLVDAALRSNVYVNAIDIRGLYVGGLDSTNSVHLPGKTEIENRIPTKGQPIVERVRVSHILASKVLTASKQQSDQEDPLAQLTSETGGILVHNSNDLYSGIKKAVDHQTFYYILTYASPDNKNDGRYHRIKLEVSRPGVKLRYREGYYAPREQISSERRRREDIIEAIQAPGNLNEIPIQLSYQFSQISDSVYQLSLLTKVNVSRLEFTSEDTRRKNSLSLVVAAFDENNKWIDGIEKVVDFNLLESSYAAMLQYGFSSKVNFNLPPGRYKVRTIVREGLKSQMGSVSRLIEVP
jgi:VWFA-related protein